MELKDQIRILQLVEELKVLIAKQVDTTEKVEAENAKHFDAFFVQRKLRKI